MPIFTTPISGWGRYPVQTCQLERPERYAGLRTDASSFIARGQGRSYGDASLNENGSVLLTERLNRLLELDVERGILRAEAGVTLAEILEVIVPRGWFLPVTPGTQFVSLGGCVAADVHGKNHHHDGAFSAYVQSLELIRADGVSMICTPESNAEVFWATVGGMGLTGVIAEVTLQLTPIKNAYMAVRNHAAANLEQLFSLMQDESVDDRYSVAWLDSLAQGGAMGRGIVMCGHHAEIDPSQPAKPTRVRKLPFDFPAWVLNPASISAFNARYYRKHSQNSATQLSHYQPYFYPLDAIQDWNRMYGKRGFVQYQCVIPQATAFEGVRELLQTLSDSRRPSFLAVLKRLGGESRGMLSFPLAGYTLALDLPIRDDGLFALLRALDEIVLRHGGRVYLAKDARLDAESFRAMYPRYNEWLAVKQSIDPELRLESSLSRRLNIGGGP